MKRVFTAKADIAMQGHIHTRPDGGTIDHRDGGFADERDIAMQLGEAVEEVLSGRVWTLCGAAVAGKSLTLGGVGGVASHVGAGAEASTDASQDDDLDIGVIVPARMYSPTLATVPFSCGADQRIHALRTIELDPQNARVLWFVEQIIDKSRSHAMPPLIGKVFAQQGMLTAAAVWVLSMRKS